MDDNEFDLIIMPTSPTPALFHNDLKSCTMLHTSYCSVWNGLDFPAATLPITYIKKGEGHLDSLYNDKIHFAARQSMVLSENMPLGLHSGINVRYGP